MEQIYHGAQLVLPEGVTLYDYVDTSKLATFVLPKRDIKWTIPVKSTTLVSKEAILQLLGRLTHTHAPCVVNRTRCSGPTCIWFDITRQDNHIDLDFMPNIHTYQPLVLVKYKL